MPASIDATVPARYNIAPDRRVLWYMVSEGPFPFSTSIDSNTSNQFPIADPVGVSILVIKAMVGLLKLCPISTNICASSIAWACVFINAPEPYFTSNTKASIPSANFLLMMLPAINGIDSTVAVTSRKAYIFLSAGAISMV